MDCAGKVTSPGLNVYTVSMRHLRSLSMSEKWCTIGPAKQISNALPCFFLSFLGEGGLWILLPYHNSFEISWNHYDNQLRTTSFPARSCRVPTTKVKCPNYLQGSPQPSDSSSKYRGPDFQTG